MFTLKTRRLFTILALVLVSASQAVAQSSTSATIAGEVKDSTGGALPGVTVEAASDALIEKVRSVATDERGQYKIVDLRPGAYVLTFTLPGFTSVQRPGLELTTGFTATVNAELRPGSIEETLTVTAASPVVDTQNVRTAALISRQVVDTLPVGKTQFSYAAMTVGISVTGAAGQDVGGNRGDASGNLVIHGSRGAESTLFVDGMRQGIGYSNGGGSNRLFMASSANVEEVSLETSGMSAESQTGGVQINVVPKEGGNAFRTFGNVAYSNNNLQGSNYSDALKARQVLPGYQIRKIYDYAMGLGGPIKKDRLWFFTSHRWWGAQENVAGNYFNKLQGTLFYEADLSRPAYANVYTQDHTVRVTWQASTKHKITFNSSNQSGCQCFQRIDQGTFSPEAANNQHYSPVGLHQVTWSYPATSKLLFQGGYTYNRNGVHFKRSEGVTTTDIPVTDTFLGYSYNAVAGGGNPLYYNPDSQRMDQFNGRLAMTYVTGSHALKAGYTFFHGISGLVGGAQDPPISYTFRNRQPTSITYYAAPSAAEARANDIALFVQDQWTINRLTINAGLRFDYLHGWVPQQTRPGGVFLPAVQIDRVDNLPRWKDLGPRLGVSYDVFGNGKTAVKAFVGRYLEAMVSGIAEQANPVSALSTQTTRNWTDNGDYVPQDSELGAPSNPLFGTFVQTTTFSPEVLEGWGVRGYNWQTSVSVQQQLASRVGMTVGYFHTTFGNFRVTDNESWSPTDFNEYCITSPSDTRLPDGGSSRLCGLFDISRTAFSAPTKNVIRQSRTFGKQREVNDFVDVALSARSADGKMLAGGVSTGRTLTDNCFVIDSPQQLYNCRQVNPWAGLTQFKLNGVYPLPYGFQASAVLQNLPGVPVLASYAATNAEILPSLGRNLGGCGAAATCSATTIVPFLFEPFTVRENRLNQLDLRLSKVVNVGRTRIQGTFDVYNALNANTILAINTRYGSSWLKPSSVLAARLVKFSAQVNF